LRRDYLGVADRSQTDKNDGWSMRLRRDDEVIEYEQRT